MNTAKFMSYFKDYMIQTFDDRNYCDKDRSLTTCGKPENYTQDRLVELNAKGAGIFFTPNQFPSGVRKKENCQGIIAWFMECDWCSKEEQMKMIEFSPLEPTFIVETQKSLHCYWLAKNASLRTFEKIQRGLIHNFQADEACKDCSRVLRIPGFNHNKQKEPFKVKLIHAKPENIYSENQMLEAFVGEKVKADNIWEAMGQLDNKVVLERMSGGTIVNGEVFTFRIRSGGGEFIDVNGQPSDAWIDQFGMIGSGKKGGPTWIQWAKYYGKNHKEIYRWAMENLQDLLPEMNQDLKVSDLDIDKQFESKRIFSWGVQKLDNLATIIQQEQYNILAGETGSGKTTFALQMAIENAKKFKVLYLSLEMSNESLLVRYALNKLGISTHDWKRGNIDKEKIKWEISNLPSNLRLKSLEETNIDTISKAVEAGVYDLVFIDNLGFVDAQGREQNEKMQNMSRKLKWLANKTKTCIIAIHHYRKRAGDSKALMRPMDSLLGTSKLSHDTNLVIQVARKDGENITEEEKKEFFVFVQKDRDFGQTDGYKIFYNQGQYV